MKLQRSISAGPRRSTEQVVQLSVSYTHELLSSQENPAADDLKASLTQLAPVLRYLVATRAFRTPALTLSGPGLELELDFDYSPDAKDDLDLPAPLQDGPGKPEPVHLKIGTTTQIPASWLDLVATAQSRAITVTLLADEVREYPSSAEPLETPAAQDGPEEPSSAEDGSPETKDEMKDEAATGAPAEAHDGKADLPTSAR